MSLVSVRTWRNISEGISMPKNDITLKRAKLEPKPTPNE